MTIQARIDDAVLAAFPAARLFAVVAKGCAKLPAQECTPSMVPADVTAMVETLAEHPAVASWRQIFTAQGLKAAQYRSSLEALLRRLTKGQAVQVGVPAVDLYNAMSVTHSAPMGAYDVAKLGATPIVLRYCQPGADSFAPIGGKAEDFPLTDKLIVYAQDSNVLCWAVNHRDSDTSRVEDTSDAVVFFAEGLTADQAAKAEAAINATRTRLQELGCDVGPMLATTGATTMAAAA